mmetsp:Transcript_22156/g.33024  ORF Transcript_22156/g.33024 Transcript_22156/m.33024 type:complete len:205 (-) Transcript_22156:1641-2255(-)
MRTSHPPYLLSLFSLCFFLLPFHQHRADFVVNLDLHCFSLLHYLNLCSPFSPKVFLFPWFFYLLHLLFPLLCSRSHLSLDYFCNLCFFRPHFLRACRNFFYLSPVYCIGNLYLFAYFECLLHLCQNLEFCLYFFHQIDPELLFLPVLRPFRGLYLNLLNLLHSLPLYHHSGKKIPSFSDSYHLLGELSYFLTFLHHCALLQINH